LPLGGGSMPRKARTRIEQQIAPATRVTASARRHPTWDGAAIDWWRGLPDHHRAGYIGIVVGIGAVICVAALLVQGTRHALLAPVGSALYALGGWGAYPLAVGLLAGGVLRVAESFARRPLARRLLPLQVLLLWLVMLAASRLVWGGDTGGVVGGLLVLPLAGLPATSTRLALFTLAAVLALAICGVTWADVGASVRLVMAAINGSVRWLTGRARGRQAPTPPDAAVASGGDAGAAPSHLTPVDQPPATGAPQPPSAHQDAATPTVAPALSARAPISHTEPAPPVRAATASPLALGERRPAPPPDGDGFAGAGATGQVWALPPLHVFDAPSLPSTAGGEQHVEHLAQTLERVLRSFRVEAEVRRDDISVGPTVIRFGIRPVEGPKRDERGRLVLGEDGQPILVRTRVNRILSLQDDLALALEAHSLRMEAPVPGQPYIGLEIPNRQGHIVALREVLASDAYRQTVARSQLAVALGRDVAGRVRVGDLARFPHVLIAGATGTGKSVCLNAFIASLLASATPEDVRLLMIDPKLVELAVYNGVPHLLAPVVTEVEGVVGVLRRALAEMERRYRLFAQLGVRNLEGYCRQTGRRPELERLPAIVVIVDELADLMMAAPAEVEGLICRLAQVGRAAGLHLVVATQRPSVDVITGLIKANISTRISFMVSSAVDSRTILDAGGAEHLLGRGDMLFQPADAGKAERVQGAFVGDEEIERLVAFWVAQRERAAHGGRPLDAGAIGHTPGQPAAARALPAPQGAGMDSDGTLNATYTAGPVARGDADSASPTGSRERR
jgi:hypothetical protein